MTILLEVALKGLIVLAAGAATAILLRRSSAAVRHLAWALTLAVVLVLPALVAVAPRIHAPERMVEAAGAWLPHGEPAVRIDAPSPRATTSLSEPAATTMSRSSSTSVSPRLPADRSGVTADAAPDGDADAAIDLAAVLAAGWAGGAIVLLGLLTSERVRLARVRRQASACDDGRVMAVFERLLHESGAGRRVRLVIGPSRVMPMTWGSVRPVVMLPFESLEWPASRLEAVIAHELAHVRRRDDVVQVAAAVTAALHWFNPLAWFALHRLRVERELACDDEVLRRGGRPSSYAQELIEVAACFRRPPVSVLSAHAMVRRSELRTRVLAVLEASRRRHGITGRRAVAGGAAALLIALPLASVGLAGPASQDTSAVETVETAETPRTQTTVAVGRSGGARVPQDPNVPTACWSPNGARISRSTTDDDFRQHEWLSDDCRAELTLRGELDFDEAFTEIIGISAGGSFRLEVEEDGEPRRLDITRSGGQVVTTWRIDGQERPYDDAARAWVRAILPALFRATGIAAEARTTSIYARDGADGVLQEVRFIRSNSVRSRYLIALFDQDGLADDDLVSALVEARAIDSNSNATRVLEAFDARHGDRLLDGPVAAAFWDTASTIDSNSNMSRLLSAIVEGEPMGSPLITRVLREAAARIDSNSTQARFLRELQQRYPGIATSGPHAEAFWTTARQIDSNSTARSFLLDLSEGEAIDSALLPIVFEMAREAVTSSSSIAEFLTAMDRRYPGIAASGPVADEFWALAREVSSSSTTSEMLIAIAAGEADGSPVLDRVLEIGTAGISSSSTLGDFLLTFARQHRGAASGRLEPAVLAAANRIGSRSTRQRTLEQLAQMGIGDAGR